MKFCDTCGGDHDTDDCTPRLMLGSNFINGDERTALEIEVGDRQVLLSMKDLLHIRGVLMADSNNFEEILNLESVRSKDIKERIESNRLVIEGINRTIVR